MEVIEIALTEQAETIVQHLAKAEESREQTKLIEEVIIHKTVPIETVLAQEDLLAEVQPPEATKHIEEAPLLAVTITDLHQPLEGQHHLQAQEDLAAEAPEQLQDPPLPVDLVADLALQAEVAAGAAAEETKIYLS